jgi:acetyl esterase/lipase
VNAELAYVIALWPLMDPYARYLYAQGTERQRQIESAEAYFLTREAMLEGNPQRILDRGERVLLPPTLIIQGTGDESVPSFLSEVFAGAYRLAGGQVQLEEFAGMPHGFGGWTEEAVARALGAMKVFLARQLAGEAVRV